MIIYLTTIDSQAQYRSFSYNFDQLEEGLETVNRIVASGSTLISVELQDDNVFVRLPPEAFDGSSMTELLQGLEKDWIAILKWTPLGSIEVQAALLGFTHQRLAACETKIIHLDISLGRVEDLRARSQKMKLAYYYRHQLESSYEISQISIKNQLDKARLTHHKLIDLISKLG